MSQQQFRDVAWVEPYAFSIAVPISLPSQATHVLTWGLVHLHLKMSISVHVEHTKVAVLTCPVGHTKVAVLTCPVGHTKVAVLTCPVGNTKVVVLTCRVGNTKVGILNQDANPDTWA